MKTPLEKRVDNLELLVHALMEAIHDTLPPAYADAVLKVLHDHKNAATDLGGWRVHIFRRKRT